MKKIYLWKRKNLFLTIENYDDTSHKHICKDQFGGYWYVSKDELEEVESKLNRKDKN